MKIYLLWAVILTAQNFSFTFVSRARNSGSLSRHAIAAMLSNLTWFASIAVTQSRVAQVLTGSAGWLAAVGMGLFYTAFTVAGSILAHSIALRTERGKARVGHYEEKKTA